MDRFSTGLVEGFYGKPWSWESRKNIVKFLSDYNYKYYIYAPKSDKYLREEWRQSWDKSTYSDLSKFREYCRLVGVEFGIGLSPFELHLNWNMEGREELRRKIQEINTLKPDRLWILFDNMTGNRDNMAHIQIDIIKFVKEVSTTIKIAFCPTYYSYDPVLKALFGTMPKSYHKIIGELLDRDIDIIWTGPEVCSLEITPEHLSEVNSLFKRPVTLWDNYPVNDSPRLTPFLFLKGFSNRSRENRSLLESHCVNPMAQPNLNKLPLATLRDLYSQGSYEPGISWYKNASTIVGSELADALWEDLDDFEFRGIGTDNTHGTLDKWTTKIEKSEFFKELTTMEKKFLISQREEFEKRISDSFTSEDKGKLLLKYSSFKNEFSDEITKWLMGFYFFDPIIFNN